MEKFQLLFEQFLAYMDAGGAVMWPLFFLTIILWYAIGYRFHALKRGSNKTVRQLIRKIVTGKRKRIKGFIDSAIVDAIKAVEGRCTDRIGRDRIEDALFPYKQELKKYRKLITTIVMIAPLIGLLGTVIGMIETFDSLGSMSLFTQGGGIAAGISQALFTTQLGLVVAVPGLIIGRLLDNKASVLELELEQIKDILCTERFDNAL